MLRRLPLGAVALAQIPVLAGVFLSFLGWRAILADLGSPLPLAGGLRVFFLGQLGKYVPGNVWPVVAQMELGRDYKVPRRSSAAAVAVFMLLGVGMGLLVGVLALPLLGHAAFARYWWTLVALPAVIVVLSPPVLNRLVELGLRLTRREPLPQRVSAAGLSRAAGLSITMWVVYGLHVWVLARSLDVSGAGLLVRSTGAYAAAWCIGFLVPVAPAGVGVREAALIFLLHTSMPTSAATVIALVSRLLFTLGDVGWGLVALAIHRRHTNEARTETPAASGPPDV